jgi:uncharacterized protein (TIGR03437 family)
MRNVALRTHAWYSVAIPSLAVLMLASPALAQQTRIAGAIDSSRRVTLAGHLNPRALASADQGEVDPAMLIPRITLMLQPSASQQAALNQLLSAQQDPSSPSYHHWLTPEQFADRFGVSQADLNQIEAWLGAQNLTVVGVARARNWIAVSGAAQAVEQALGTQIHSYVVNGEQHYANATEPSIPASLSGVVTAIRGLTDFRLRPAVRPRGPVSPIVMQPQYNSANACSSAIAPSGHCLGPDDVATIYDITPLFNAGLNGSGQTIVVAGQTDIRTSDIAAYRTFFNLPAINLQQTLVPGSPDPGISTGDLGESDLDIELASAVARNATINFVYSSDVMTSAQYAIDENLAPVLSISYGDCEAAYSAREASGMQSMAQQANTEGITWFASSGDNGATDCYGDNFSDANSVVSVDMPASLPEVTGIGGTEFTEGTGNYWSATNSATNASALSYIPETAWNDSALVGSPDASGGGASVYFAKPSWQTGTGVPADNARDVPDLAISASDQHDYYLIFSSDPSLCGSNPRVTSTCETGVGGTSVGPPSFAGLIALLNQSFVSKGLESSPGLGNINPKLYSLAQATPSAFHDITTGNNIISVTCSRAQPNCSPESVGFSAGPGYDQVTGWGSVDASALASAWTATLGPATATPTGPPTIVAVANAGSYAQAYAPGEIIAIFGTQLAASTQAAASVPLSTLMAGVTVSINGVAAPLLYVSATQLNVQIPYETPVNTSVNLTVDDNGQKASTTLTATAAAPGIFVTAQGTPVPYTTAAQGQTITLFVTGAGAVSPAQADGASPSAGTPAGSLPMPQQTVTVTVGGVNAPVQFTGIPAGLVGVLQVNYQVPSGAPVGAQPVVVNVGGVASNSATLVVTP